MELRDLELLVDVSETNSLGQAAARHGLTQPAVSMRMTAMERALGLTLLERDPSGTRLTSDGKEIVAVARDVLAAGSRLAAVADRLRAESAARLRVAASFTVAEYLAPAWIDILRSELPGVALALEVENSTQVVAAVEQGRVDIGFVESPDHPVEGIVTEPVCCDTLEVVVARSHPWAGLRRPLSGEELAATDLIVREPGSGTRDVLEEALVPWGGVRTRLELGSSAAVLAAARRGEAPAVLSRLAAAADVAAGDLRAVEVTGLDLSRNIRAVWRQARGPGPLARRLLAAAHGHPGPARSCSSPKIFLGGLQRRDR